MSDYIMDMRKALNDLYGSRTEVLEEVIATRLMIYESDHYPGVYPEDLKVGDRLYLHTSPDGYMMSTYYWVEIEVTHLYGGVIFYKVVNAFDCPEEISWEGERHMEYRCIASQRSLYPKKVVITKDFIFASNCPMTEFICDENPDSTYSSVYELKEERKF